MGCILNDPVGLIIKYCVFCKRNSQHLSNCCGWFTVTSSSRLPIYATASRGARQFPLVRQSLIGETEGIVGDGQDRSNSLCTLQVWWRPRSGSWDTRVSYMSVCAGSVPGELQGHQLELLQSISANTNTL